MPTQQTFTVQTGNVPWSPIHDRYGVFQPKLAGPSNKSIYPLFIFKGKDDLVQLAKDFPCEYELTSLYAECPRMFGEKPSQSFASFVQALAIHKNIVAQTFF